MSSSNTVELVYVPKEEIDRIWNETSLNKYEKLGIISDICRLNALTAVKKAGSGHLGSSFSSMDIFVYLYFCELNVVKLGVKHPDRDIFFSSKGHDCPGMYSVMAAVGIIPFERLWMLRRLGGLDGHPDVRIPGVEANSGSLGMGISKAKGMALAKKLDGRKGRVIVLTGDGELQEGQIWESLQVAVAQGVTNLIVISDFNKIQTDRPVEENVSLLNIEEKIRVFGWYVERFNGHDFVELERSFEKAGQITDRPKFFIADTVKGKGVSFMEGPTALKEAGGLYPWHAGAPADEYYEKARDEIIARIREFAKRLGLGKIRFDVLEKIEKNRVRLKDKAEKVVKAFEDALVRLGKERQDIVVLDADLAADCGLRKFESLFPERFFECGIAEQDMVSTAGGLALQGYLPIVNSFGVFLASRANEQIYTNATERTKIIYVCHYAGMIPAGPGKSHQSVRDISLFGALPNCVIVEPCNGEETEALLRWCVYEADSVCMIRLVISPSPRKIVLPAEYHVEFGKGVVLYPGNDAILFSYGPVMLNEALSAAEILSEDGIGLKVVNMPWLNRVDLNWLKEVIGEIKEVYVLDNHMLYGGLGDSMLNALNEVGLIKNVEFYKLGLLDYPECGRPLEVLSYHGLDGKSLARYICGGIKGK